MPDAAAESAPSLNRPAGPLAAIAVVLSALWILLIPLAVSPAFFEAFHEAKALVALALGLPLLVLARLALRGHTPKALAQFRTLAAAGTLAILGAQLARDAIWPAPGSEAALVAWTRPLRMLFVLLVSVEAGTLLLRARRSLTLVLSATSALTLALVIGIARRRFEAFAWIPDRPDVSIAATIGNSNALAEWAAPLLIWILGLPLLPRGLAYLLGIPGIGLIFVSESRGAMLAVAVGWLALIIGGFTLKGLSKDARFQTRGLVAVLLLTLGTFFFAPGFEQVRARLGGLLEADGPGARTLEVRQELWASSLDMVGEAPARSLLGHGVGRFPAAVQPFRSPEEEAAESQRLDDRFVIAESPHQEFLWLLGVGGLPGLLLGLGALFLVSRAWLQPGPLHGTEQREALLAAGAGLLTAFVLCLGRSPLHHAAGILSIGLLTGTILSHGPALRQRGWLLRAEPIATLLLVALVATLSTAHIANDHALQRSIHAKRMLAESLREGTPAPRQAAAREAWLVSAGTVQALADSPLLDWRHAYRASLVASDHEAFARRARKSAALAVPEEALLREGTTLRLLDRTLAGFPGHAKARIERNRWLALSDAPLTDRRENLEAAIAAAPAYPGLRPLLADLLAAEGSIREALTLCEAERQLTPADRNLLSDIGRLRLALGREPADAGALLLAWATLDEQSDTGRRMLQAAQDAFRSAAAASADNDHPRIATARLVAMGTPGTPFEILAHATRLEIVEALSQEALTSARSSEGTARERWRVIANAAIARNRLWLAWDALRIPGQEASAKRHLRFARRKDPRLLDVELLTLLIAEKNGDSAAAKGSLERLAASGVSGVEVERLRSALRLDRRGR